jgi:AcrR family transcriptional regulator
VGGARLELLHGGATYSDPRPGAEVAGRTKRLPAASSSTQRIRIIDGALACIARQGVAKTTLDDVAREAGCSRATVYRVFPGGKDGVLGAVADTEVSRLFSSLAVRMGEATRIEDVLVAGMTQAATTVSEHPALTFLLEHEPEVVLPHLAFSHMDSLLSVSSAFTAPFLGRWVDHDEARRVAEWAARILISYLACPAEGIDITDDECVRRLVRTYVLPGIRTVRDHEGAVESPVAGAFESTAEKSDGHNPTKSLPTTGKGEQS